MQAYVDLVCKEIVRTTTAGPPAPLETVFFGGGTPSLCPTPLVAQILEHLSLKFGIAAGAEISLEADPGTFGPAQLQEYRRLGVNRLSVGVQCFDEGLLAKCGRSHSLGDVYRAIEDVQGSGVPTWSLDLISGLPHLDLEIWRHTLEECIKAAPPHVSVYDLQVEEGTPFARWYQAGTRPLPEDDDAAEMYSLASRMLRGAGYEHYEVSSYAQPGHRCVHNQVYWQMRPYHGFGLGAASFMGGQRFSRPRKMAEYTAWVDALVPEAGGTTLEASQQLPQSAEECMLDTVMLRLRTSDGLELGGFREGYGRVAEELVLGALARHVRAGLVVGYDGGGGAVPPSRLGNAARVRLKDPEGFLVSNDIIADVFAALSGTHSGEEGGVGVVVLATSK